MTAGECDNRDDSHAWDPVRWRAVNRPDRRYTVGDISRPRGGVFDSRFGAVRQFGRGPGGSGHVSHQNGSTVDIHYPRKDRRERAPGSLDDVDRRLAQDLVDRFVAAGAQFAFVGPHTGLRGPPSVVQPLARHDDHLHFRLRPPG